MRSSLKYEGIAKVACFNISSKEPVVFECHIIKLSPLLEKIYYKFLPYLFNSSTVRNHLVSLSITTTMTTISQDSIANIKVLYPPFREQKKIVDHIEKEIFHINAKIKKLKNLSLSLKNIALLLSAKPSPEKSK